LVDGLFLLKITADDKRIVPLAESGFPFILVNHKNKKSNFIDSENIKGARIAFDYLYRLGHRKIAFVTGSLNETNAQDRFQGFKEAMIKHNLKINEKWIINGDFSEDTAFQQSEKLFKDEEIPTAVFCSDDYMAIGVLKQIKRQGLSVPEDISLIGFDDIELASYIKPALTTIRQPMPQLGGLACNTLLKIIDKQQETPVHRFLEVELIKRESCSKI